MYLSKKTHMNIGEFYINNLRKLQLIPIAIMLTMLAILFYIYFTTGYFIERDISLKGGSMITITTDKDTSNVDGFLSSRFPDYEFSTRKLTEFGTSATKGITIETNMGDIENLKQVLEEFLNIRLSKENFSAEFTESSLGSSFTYQIIRSLIVAFILMAIVVFITFRVFVPGLAVIFAAIFDIIVS